MKDKIFVASIKGTWGNDPEKVYYSDPKPSKFEAYLDLAGRCHDNAISANWSQVAMAEFEIARTTVINPHFEFVEELGAIRRQPLHAQPAGIG